MFSKNGNVKPYDNVASTKFTLISFNQKLHATCISIILTMLYDWYSYNHIDIIYTNYAILVISDIPDSIREKIVCLVSALNIF